MNSTGWPPAGVNLPKSARAVVSWFRSALFMFMGARLGLGGVRAASVARAARPPIAAK